MNMKKLLILPIVGIVVSMLGVSVMAASATKDFTATEVSTGKDITIDYDGTQTSATAQDLTTIDGLSDKVKAVNSEADLSKAELVTSFDISDYGKHSGNSEKVTITFTGVAKKDGDVFIVFHDGQTEYSVGTTPSITVDYCSPFFIYRISVTSSAPTGQYAAPYLVMVSVALVACGARRARSARGAGRTRCACGSSSARCCRGWYGAA